MRVPPRVALAPLIALAGGLAWLALGFARSGLVTVIAGVPGVLLVATATALLCWPGDRHVTHVLALAALVSPLFALLLAPWFGLVSLGLAMVGVACFLVAGYTAARQAVVPPGVALPPLDWRVCLKTAADEALLGFFVAFARLPRGPAVARDAREVAALDTLIRNRVGASDTAALHERPATPTDFRRRAVQSKGCDFEWLDFDSGYRPEAAMPGAERWQSHRANRRMAARIFEHPGEPRPWLICIHGYRMGLDGLDLSLFRAKRLHHKLGLNVAMPILPLHGVRRLARVTGGHYLDGPIADLFHATRQGLWDLRRLKAWIAARQTGVPIGVLGYSLGGYHAALMAAFESDLACVIAGIPLTDIPAALWQHMPHLQRRYMQAQGLTPARLSALMAPVSPLHLAPVLAPERRYIFAATADQLVDPDQPYRLWRHWDRPAVCWYHGSHLSVRREAVLQRFIDDALSRHGLIVAGAGERASA